MRRARRGTAAQQATSVTSRDGGGGDDGSVATANEERSDCGYSRVHNPVKYILLTCEGILMIDWKMLGRMKRLRQVDHTLGRMTITVPQKPLNPVFKARNLNRRFNPQEKL